MTLMPQRTGGCDESSSLLPADRSHPFALVAMAHALRLYNRWPLQLDPMTIAPGLPWIGLDVAAALSAWGFRAARR